MSTFLGHSDEQNLLHLIAEGDEKAFRSLFDKHHPKLGGYVFRLTNSFELTQEIVQDAFLKVWSNRHALRDINNFDAYLFTIARNHTFNVLKQMAREQARKKAWEQTQENELTVLAEELSGYKEISAIMQKAIEQLPPRQKDVFTLSREGGLTHEQISERLGIALETVKKHMVLALKAIRTYVSAHTISILVFFVKLIVQAKNIF
ncbi:RNA polymerase sigma factor [Pinibacter aurantiacus]|uniref:RNA polymerase sigma factor n=1 Tax=Pinibacter aurantiacus TaxID=2851599 RepID=A0A9E2SA14_9BACT|nr:RNA polymerase sigma-70 factor [Pinibacter aurantiacus]MBV4359196.1 RNA polymerase sigma-70 factor [Pinibacter aurantiacus]